MNDSYEATGEMYNRVVDMLMLHIARVGQERCNIVCATHNEAAAIHAASKVSKRSEVRRPLSVNELIR